MRTPSDEDLLMAAFWLEQYENDESDETPDRARMLQVAEWLNAQVSKRREDRAVRQVARQSGASLSRSREVLRRTMQRDHEPEVQK